MARHFTKYQPTPRMADGQAMIGELCDHCNKITGWEAREWNKHGKARIYINVEEYADCKIYYDYPDLEVAYTNTLDAREMGWALDRGAKLRVWHDDPRRRDEVWQQLQGTMTLPVMNWGK